MKARCQNPNDKKYPAYGGRGITVCERWMKFEHFFSDMGDKPTGMTLGRINNDGGYAPANCRWETQKQQQRNRRGLRPIAAFGKTQLQRDWARELGISESRLHYALKRGESVELVASRL